jgi:hypothetical protein
MCDTIFRCTACHLGMSIGNLSNLLIFPTFFFIKVDKNTGKFVQIPATINRLCSSLFVPPESHFVICLIASIVLPLQGFWNSVIYVVISSRAVRALFATMKLQLQGLNCMKTPGRRPQNPQNKEPERSSGLWKELRNWCGKMPHTWIYRLKGNGSEC